MDIFRLIILDLKNIYVHSRVKYIYFLPRSQNVSPTTASTQISKSQLNLRNSKVLILIVCNIQIRNGWDFGCGPFWGTIPLHPLDCETKEISFLSQIQWWDRTVITVIDMLVQKGRQLKKKQKKFTIDLKIYQANSITFQNLEWPSMGLKFSSLGLKLCSLGSCLCSLRCPSFSTCSWVALLGCYLPVEFWRIWQLFSLTNVSFLLVQGGSISDDIQFSRTFWISHVHHGDSLD